LPLVFSCKRIISDGINNGTDFPTIDGVDHVPAFIPPV